MPTVVMRCRYRYYTRVRWRNVMRHFAKIARCVTKKIRFAILSAWAATLALAQTGIAQAAYPGYDVPKLVGLNGDAGTRAKYRPHDPGYRQTRIAFKTETRKFEFPYGIIISQTNSRPGMRNYNRSKTDTVEVWDRHDCSINVCAPRNKNPHHHPRSYSRTAAPTF
jgi:hypothetical protein